MNFHMILISEIYIKKNNININNGKKAKIYSYNNEYNNLGLATENPDMICI